MNKLIDTIIKKYKFILIAILLISVFFGYFYSRQRVVNHIDVFFDKNDPDLKFYKRFQNIYGNEELGAVIFKDKNVFTKENIEIIRMISKMASEVIGVQRVFSITEHKEAVGRKDSVIFEKIIPDGKLNEQALKTAKARTLNNRVLVENLNLISSDGSTTAIMIELEPVSSNEKKAEILQFIRDSVNKIAPSRLNIRFSGTSYIEVEINALSRKDRRLGLFILLIIFAIVALVLKKISISLFCQINIFLVGIWSIGFFTLCGESLNMVTVIISPVLLAISVADSIHILAHYREVYLSNGYNHTSAVSEATKALWLPCLFTSLTTGIGFLSFITSNVRPVKIVGIFTSSGVMFAFFLTITFLPATLMLLTRRFNKDNLAGKKQLKMFSPAHNEEGLFTNLLIKTGNFTVSNYKSILIIFLIVLFFTIAGIYKIKYETNFVNYLPDENRVKSDIVFIEQNLGGTVPVVMLFQAKFREIDFTHSRSLRLLEEIQSDIMKLMEGRYTSSFSIADYFKEINKAFNGGMEEYYRIPESRTDIIDFYEIGDAEVLDRIIAPDKMEARVSFRAHVGASTNAVRKSKTLNKYLKKKLGKNYTYKSTGRGPLYVSMDSNLKKSQIKSFLSAFLIIFFLMFFVCRNIKLAIISMIPNLFPIFLTLGVMGWLNIPLDVATIMIASVTIGIAVDDTIHYIIWFKRNISTGMDTESSLLKTYKDVGKPIVTTSVVLFLGFFILILGMSKPTRAFGVLTAFAMFYALIGDLLILPALILIFKPKIKKSII